MSQKLMLVESPNKTKTLKGFLGPDFTVMASVGHICKIRDGGLYNMGINPDKDFEADYVVSADKKEIVNNLKEQVKKADEVYICSDPDREGEAIAWHLKRELKIPESKYKRVTFHEITKGAVLKALESPRKIDLDLVNAATARQKLDKIVGYRLSPIARRSVQAKSVGRCQSAGLKLLVEREEEIRNFQPMTYFDLYLNFIKNNKDFKAKYVGTDNKEVKYLPSGADCDTIKKQCFNNPYIINNIEKKEQLENPKPPFITNTYLQEAARKLNLDIKEATEYAQKLFEGIEVNGKHIALITYIRTDDATYAPEFLPLLEDYVKDRFGNNYYAPVKAAKQSANSQEGHEAIRPVDLEMTPEKLAKYTADSSLLSVYELIYKRTVASAMKPAVISNTIYSIYNLSNKFIMNSRELIFDGYRKVYSYKEDDAEDEDGVVKETFSKGETLRSTKLEAIKKETTPPKRYMEDTFVKELDKKGIGRPSTFPSIISTLLSKDRDYCRLEKKYMIPTEKGISLSHFLDNSFSDIININYTSDLEKDLDKIAKGKLNDVEFLSTFYAKLEDSIKKVDSSAIASDKISESKICSKCGAKMILRKGKYGLFWGCSNYPKCKGIEKYINKSS